MSLPCFLSAEGCLFVAIMTDVQSCSFISRIFCLRRCGNFLQLSISTVVATVAALVSLYTLPKLFGLTGVWMSFGVFNSFRLAGVWIHQTKTGPLSESALVKAA